MKDALRAQLDNAYVCFERSTRALTEEDSTFTPADGTFTAAGQVAHAAQTIDWFVEGAFRREGFDTDFEAHHRDVRAVTSLTEARAWLTRSVENARQVIANRTEEEWAAPLPPGEVMGGLPRASIFNGITDHTAHHRGALTIYTRARGKAPPNPYVDV